MYRTYIPVMAENAYKYKEETLKALKRAKCDVAMLAMNLPRHERLDTDSFMPMISELIEYYKQNGMETGVWTDSIGHGTLPGKYAYRSFTSIEGKATEGCFCPNDERFVSDFCEYMKNIARTGAKLILLDDDFRMYNHGSAYPGCICPECLKMYQKLVGEKKITREDIYEKVFSGGKNKYRDAWLKLQSSTLLGFAAKIRAAVDEIDDSVRIGLCSSQVISCDGTNNNETARVLAGKTKPFLRELGAPYWAANKLGFLGCVVNIERYSFADSYGKGIETVSEGDTYPRPRFVCPASFLECEEQILIADGHADGILKYIFEYAAPPKSEEAYLDAHIKNKKTRADIAKFFSKSTDGGIRIVENKAIFRDAEMNETLSTKENGDLWKYKTYNSVTFDFANDNSLPVNFTSDGTVLSFGDSVRYIENFENGVITDLAGARILSKQGIDTGLVSYSLFEGKNSVLFGVLSEEYAEYGDSVALFGTRRAYRITASDKAKVKTEIFHGKEKIGTGAFLYENADGKRFLVLPFVADVDAATPLGLFKSYSRQRLVIESVGFLAGKPLEAYCLKYPYAYILVKKIKDGHVVGLWNLYPDAIDEPTVFLSQKYGSIEFLNTSGKLLADRVVLSRLEPYSFAAFKVKK